MRHIIPISGKDSLATALVQYKTEPKLNYEFMFNPTGAELPEVLEWLKLVEKHFDKKIIRIGEDLESVIEEYNFYLPNNNSRYCTRRSKIEPMEDYIGNDDCLVYYGIRSDEKRIGYINNKRNNIIPKFPLIENGIGIEQVYYIINSYGLKPPTFFWKNVFDDVFAKMKNYKWKEYLTEWQFDILFAWRTRSNCFFCFNQRLYEWAGLFQHYPDLFWKAEWYEHQSSEYCWIRKGKPLKEFAKEVNSIVKKRVDEICSILIKLNQQTNNLFPQGEYLKDELNISFCGLFCGK